MLRDSQINKPDTPRRGSQPVLEEPSQSSIEVLDHPCTRHDKTDLGKRRTPSSPGKWNPPPPQSPRTITHLQSWIWLQYCYSISIILHPEGICAHQARSSFLANLLMDRWPEFGVPFASALGRKFGSFQGRGAINAGIRVEGLKGVSRPISRRSSTRSLT